MINEGPGSYSHHAGKSATAYDRSLAAQAKTPGTRDPISGLKKGSLFAVIRGVVSGYGWEHNIDHTMAVLNATLDLPHTINMAGWSRGATTCFMIAHALNENPRTKAIAVNICAVDPVSGPGNFDDPEKVTLPANVKSYAAIVQEDERRKIFKPALVGVGTWRGRRASAGICERCESAQDERADDLSVARAGRHHFLNSKRLSHRVSTSYR